MPERLGGWPPPPPPSPPPESPPPRPLPPPPPLRQKKRKETERERRAERGRQLVCVKEREGERAGGMEGGREGGRERREDRGRRRAMVISGGGGWGVGGGRYVGAYLNDGLHARILLDLARRGRERGMGGGQSFGCAIAGCRRVRARGMPSRARAQDAVACARAGSTGRHPLTHPPRPGPARPSPASPALPG
jgi:hypothetical protein